jgi:predicted TIM-barrel fold metal-dependent hydrolase
MPLLRTRTGAAILGTLLRNVIPFGRFDRFDRMAAFATIGNLASQRKIFELLCGFYPQGTRFVVLPMDMDFMNAGTAPEPYVEQLEELRGLHEALAVTDPDVLLPFVAVDPRRPRILDLVKRFVEEHHFRGIKLYPPLGYFPSNPALDEVYAYAEANGIPVLSHCSRGGVYHHGALTPEMRRDPVSGKTFADGSPARVTDHYAHPEHFRHVAERFPRLRICLAHYGGGDEWRRHLKDPWAVLEAPPEGAEPSWLSVTSELIRKYDNVYADLAYTASEPAFRALIKLLCLDTKLRDRILFGSDFYMLQRSMTEREYSISLRADIGEDAWELVARRNPLRFLGEDD